MADLSLKHVQMGARLAAFVLNKTIGVDPFAAVMEALGGGARTDDASAFTAAILPRLDAIRNQLNDVQRDVQAVSRQATRILLSIQGAEFQIKLGGYERDANVLRNQYDRWLSALGGLRSSAAGERAEGARLLFDVTSGRTASAVGEAMRNVGTFLLGAPPFRGVLAYIPDVLDADVQGVDRPRLATICGHPCYDSFYVLRQFHPQYTTTVDASILPLFASALTVLHKGITLLEMSYVGTIQQNELRLHYANIVRVCEHIRAFWGTHTQGAVLEAAMRRAFEAVGRATVDLDLRLQPWADWTMAHPDPWTDGGAAAWPFPPDVRNWLTVASRPEGLPPGWSGTFNGSGPTVSLIPTGFQFGTSVDQVAFQERRARAGKPWVGYGREFRHMGENQRVAYPVPTLSALFGPGGPPPELRAMSDRIASLELLTPPPLT